VNRQLRATRWPEYLIDRMTGSFTECQIGEKDAVAYAGTVSCHAQPGANRLPTSSFTVYSQPARTQCGENAAKEAIVAGHWT
jgi:hypothetical protein